MDQSAFIDSLYEMDAPQCVDFNATDQSVNESIFGKFLRILFQLKTLELTSYPSF